jgi:hypothetical protein
MCYSAGFLSTRQIGFVGNSAEMTAKIRQSATLTWHIFRIQGNIHT